MLAALVGGALLNGVTAWIAMTCCFSVGLVVGGNGVVNGVVSGVVGSGVVIGGIVVGVVNGVVGVVGIVVGGGGVVGAVDVLNVDVTDEVAPSSSNKNASCLLLIVLSGGRTM